MGVKSLNEEVGEPGVPPGLETTVEVSMLGCGICREPPAWRLLNSAGSAERARVSSV